MYSIFFSASNYEIMTNAFKRKKMKILLVNIHLKKTFAPVIFSDVSICFFIAFKVWRTWGNYNQIPIMVDNLISNDSGIGLSMIEILCPVL